MISNQYETLARINQRVGDVDLTQECGQNTQWDGYLQGISFQHS